MALIRDLVAVLAAFVLGLVCLATAAMFTIVPWAIGLRTVLHTLFG